MKCHYEVLNIPKEASGAEIKTAYRKLALQWHPDKNLDNLVAAKEQFQLIQNAYEVLSDPQERAWYDNHREQLLRGAGSSYNDDSLNVFPYFSPSCYKGFGDDSKGFYAVYNEVFSKLAAEETEFLDDPEDVKNIPKFGKTDTPFEQVHEFYSYWMSFSTSKSFVWLDQHDIQQGDNRRIIKLMEKENNKIRQKAKKERNEEIRRLVSFVRRKDKRVQEHAKILQEKAEENKRKAEQLRKERIIQRQKEIQEVQKRQGDTSLVDAEYQKRLQEIENLVQQEFGLSSDDDDTVSENGMESSNEDSSKTEPSEMIKPLTKSHDRSTKVQNLYCTACNKLFKNVKSFENHEKSKKHRENVANMTVDLDISDQSDLESDEALDNKNEDEAIGDINVTENNAEEDEEQELKDRTDSKEANDICSLSDESDIQEKILKSEKKKNKKKKVFTCAASDDGNDSHDEMSLTEVAPTRSRRAKKINSSKILLSERKKQMEAAAVELKPEPTPIETAESIPSISSNQERGEASTKNKNKAKTDGDKNHYCAVCQTEFASKNKLFDHLKKTGHSIPLAQSNTSQKKGKKTNRKLILG